MKKIVAILSLAFFCLTLNAQVTNNYQKPDDSYTLDSDGKIVKKKKALFERNKKKKDIDPKYLAGGVPEENGRVYFERTINVPGKSAKEIYDTTLRFLMGFVKSEGMLENSNVSVVNPDTKEIGARVQEWLVFENHALSLDRTKFYYQLIVNCSDEKCNVRMRGLSYLYEEDRGGKLQPAEDIITDEQSLNKAKDGFQKGGVRKFRMKTIDRAEEVFLKIEAALK